jgi:hypothetical protein
MSSANLELELADLFQETGEAHHKAFAETDGDDPEWPIWYAEFVHDDLAKLLDATFTKSELVYLLVLADNDRRAISPGSDWTAFFAMFFMDRYA